MQLQAAAGIAGTMLLAACASIPPAPTAALQAAQQAITSAEKTDAGHYAPGELGSARTKLASANTAVAAEKMLPAEWLAQESRADAELATAKAAAAKATEVNAELKSGNASLTEELQRNSGTTP
jgi:hypothetical protein